MGIIFVSILLIKGFMCFLKFLSIISSLKWIVLCLDLCILWLMLFLGCLFGGWIWVGCWVGCGVWLWVWSIRIWVLLVFVILSKFVVVVRNCWWVNLGVIRSSRCLLWLWFWGFDEVLGVCFWGCIRVYWLGSLLIVGLGLFFGVWGWLCCSFLIWMFVCRWDLFLMWVLWVLSSLWCLWSLLRVFCL